MVYRILCGQLLNDNTHIMSESDAIAHKHIVPKLFGNVLLAGLGLGLLAKDLDKSDKVKGITVVEKEQEIIDLVPLLDTKKVSIHCGDIWDYIKECSGFDSAYFDIWSDIAPGIDKKIERFRDECKRYIPETEVFMYGD